MFMKISNEPWLGMMKCNGSSELRLQKVPTLRLYWPDISGQSTDQKNIKRYVLIDDNGATISLIGMDKLRE